MTAGSWAQGCQLTLQEGPRGLLPVAPVSWRQRSKHTDGTHSSGADRVQGLGFRLSPGAPACLGGLALRPERIRTHTVCGVGGAWKREAADRVVESQLPPNQSPQVIKEQHCLLQWSQCLSLPLYLSPIHSKSVFWEPRGAVFFNLLFFFETGSQPSEGGISSSCVLSFRVGYTSFPNLCAHHPGHWGQALHLSGLLLLFGKWISDSHLTTWG